MKRTALVLVLAVASVAALAQPSRASNSEARQVVREGPLGIMFTNVTLPTTTLTGTNLTLQTTAQTQWVAQDARGTGNGWSITIAVEGALTSGAGTFDTTPRTIAASNLTFAPGTVTALSGSDPTTNITTSNLTLSTSAQTFLSCSSMCKGRYGFHPTVTLAVPANAYRSNFTGAVNASALNPYTATLVFTIS